MLEALRILVKDLESTSSNTEKQKRLVKHLKQSPSVEIPLRLVYEPLLQFYLTHDTAMKKGKLFRSHRPILEVLELLSERKVTGQRAMNMWFTAVQALPHEDREYAGRILDKDLKCRMGVSTVNKVFKQLGKQLVYVHAVSLGHSWKGEEVWNDGVWFASRKLDGVRCSATVKRCPVLLSRQGKLFDTTSKIEAVLAKWEGPACVLDGELALRTEDGRDDFLGLMSQIRRKEHTIENIVFHVFDWIPLEGEIPVLHKRLKYLKNEIIPALGSDRICFVPQTRIKGTEHFNSLMAKSQKLGWEGLILRKDAPYVGKRTKDLLKVKLMQDLEARVKSIETGTMNIVKDGREKVIDAMRAAVIDFKGGEVSVGSGWSMQQRRQFFKHPEQIIGKVLTVQYFEETTNKAGEHSLRFPVVKIIHGEERNT